MLLQEDYYRSMIVQSVAEASTIPREGSDRVLSTLAKHKVPTLVFSAGIGDVIEEFFIQHWGPLPDSLHVISNRMRFDESGKLVGFSDPLIHVFNKVREPRRLLPAVRPLRYEHDDIYFLCCPRRTRVTFAERRGLSSPALVRTHC